MFTNAKRNSKPRLRLAGTFAVALAAVAMVGLTSISPAMAWYDSYGYWHPDRRYRESERREAYWRHREWCERHPYACYQQPYYGNSYDYYYHYDR